MFCTTEKWEFIERFDINVIDSIVGQYSSSVVSQRDISRNINYF